MVTELLQAVRVLDPVSGTDAIADVLVVEGTIQAIGADLAPHPLDTRITPAQGLILGPGLIDLYSHSSEPGFESRETLDSLLQAAAAGGFTRLALLPDTQPALDNPASIAWIHAARQQAIRTQSLAKTLALPETPALPASDPDSPLGSLPYPTLHPWAALTQGLAGQNLTELSELATTAIAGFADGLPLKNVLLVQRLLEYLHLSDRPIALWPCDLHLVGQGAVRDGRPALRFGLPGIPDLSETAALAMLLECVVATGTPVHLMRVSTARGVEMIRAAKAQGLPVTASTTWMHLLLSTEDLGSYDPHLRLSPPLGNPHDRQALVQGVQMGVMDAIAIDHTPYTYEEKTVAFAEAPPGAIGLELALPLLWHGLVETQQLSALELWRGLSTMPATCLRQRPPSITPGTAAEMTLFDPHVTWTVTPRSLKSLAANTPWWGKTLTGRVLKTWLPA
jgi:dihydroorotase